MNTLLKSCLILLFLTFTIIAEARLLHVIHTNDLHSYFDGVRDGRGGYARLKTRILELKARSQAQGIEVLQLDGGDFGEGTSYFMSDEGANSVRLLGDLGTEISVIGNHDHLMGGNILGKQIRRAQVPTKFVSANLVQTPAMDLGDLVKPSVDVTRGGIKIRVIGLSTHEIHYQYSLKDERGKIKNAIDVGVAESARARKEGRELVIALTHIGQGKDADLAKASSEIDVIVGGHSHDFLENVRWERNKKKKPVPIVQAGAHGLVVGSLLLDLKDNGSVSVVEYKLHKIEDKTIADYQMLDLVAQAQVDRNYAFGGRWDEVIGESEITLSGYVNGRPQHKQSCWGQHMAKMTKEAVGATLGIHLPDFEGEQIPAGQITFGDIVDNFPHVRKFGDAGWKIATIRVKGNVLKILLDAILALKSKLGISYYGLKYKKILGIPYHFRSDTGEKIKTLGTYTMAFPSEVGHALKEQLPHLTKILFPSLTETNKHYWEVMEEYIRRNSPLRCL